MVDAARAVGNKSALALLAHDKMLRHQFIKRLAYCSLMNVIFNGELHFARQHLARTPFSFSQPVEQHLFDLGIQRTERGLRRIAGSARICRFTNRQRQQFSIVRGGRFPARCLICHCCNPSGCGLPAGAGICVIGTRGVPLAEPIDQTAGQKNLHLAR